MLPFSGKLDSTPINQVAMNSPTSTNTHGGKRVGAGRKPSGIKTARVSVPEAAKAVVIDFVKALKEPMSAVWGDSLKPIKLAENLNPFKVPLYAHSVKAGFPSPADDYVADTIDLNDLLMPRKEASFLIRVSGDSMVGAGIHDGDTLVVDRSIAATDGRVVVAAVDGQFTVKRLEKRHGRVRLLAENPNFSAIEFKDEQELQIWGVVTRVIHSV